MVNVGFPPLGPYGFEMVDAEHADKTIQRARQSKIYTESNQSAFLQILAALNSMQTLVIYRRLLIRTGCEINRNACKRSQRK
jgi:hypothetical protein